MVSEVSFPRFWGVLCIVKCFRFFVSVIGSAVFEISRFAQFYVKSLIDCITVQLLVFILADSLTDVTSVKNIPVVRIRIFAKSQIMKSVIIPS